MTLDQWAYVRDALAFVGVVATVAAILSNVAKFLEFLGFNPRVRLACTGWEGPYARDPLVHAFYEEWVNKDRTLVAAGHTTTGTYWADNARRGDDRLSKYRYLEIENTGKTTLKNVQLRIPGLMAVRYRIGHPDAPVEATTPLVLGDMVPLDKKTIHAWSGGADNGTYQLTLVHDAGHGIIRVSQHRNRSINVVLFDAKITTFFTILKILAGGLLILSLLYNILYLGLI